VPGRDDFSRVGSSNGDPHETPVDLAAVQADDALLDLIGRAGHTPGDADDELTRVLAAWRREVHAEPFGELVDTNTALAVILAARRPARRHIPVFSSIAAAAAVLVIAFSAVGLVAKSAQPGDRLWGVTQVLYSDYAHSVETAAKVRTELNEAKVALRQGKPEQARASLRHVQQQLPAIGEAEGRTDLTARHNQLEQMLNGSPDAGSADLPGAPMFPPPGATGTRHQPSMSPKSDEPPTSTDSTTTPDSTTEPPSSTAATRPKRFSRGREYPDRGYPGPDGISSDRGPSSSGVGPSSSSIGPSSSSIGPAGSGTTGSSTTGSSTVGSSTVGSSTVGQTHGTTGGGTRGDAADGATSSGGTPPASGVPGSHPAGSAPSTRGYANNNPPSGNPSSHDVLPECSSPGVRPPYCG
jgi:Anti-sigma-D factor RsdA to sigma factor binding region